MDVMQRALACVLSDIACRYELDESALFQQYLGGPQERVKVGDLSPVTLDQLPVLPAMPEAPPVAVQPPVPVGTAKKGKGKGKGKTLEARATCDYTEAELDGVNVSALKVLCKAHGLTQGGKKDSLIARLLNPQDGLPKKRGGKKKKAEKAPEPEHDHEMDEEHHTDCKACEVQGNILDPDAPQDFDLDLGDTPAASPVTSPVHSQLQTIMMDDDDGCEIHSDAGDSDLELVSDIDGDDMAYMDELCEEE